MGRRRFLLTALAGAIASPRIVGAQQIAKVPRIGLLDYARFWDPLLEKLAELGYVEGQTIIFEYRASAGRPERLPTLAQELVERRVDVIVAYGTPVTRAAESATTTIPIVMVGIGDPVKAGLVRDLGHPGGNATGNTILGPDIGAKRLQLLRETLPNVSRVAFLWNPQNASTTLQFENVQRAAPALGVTLLSVRVSDASELDNALDDASQHVLKARENEFGQRFTAEFQKEFPKLGAGVSAQQSQPGSPPSSASSIWYYCAESKTYYPYVQHCPRGWVRVAPKTAPSRQ